MKDRYTLNQFAEKVGVQPNTVRTWYKTNPLNQFLVTDGLTDDIPMNKF